MELPARAVTPVQEHPNLHLEIDYDLVMLDWEGKDYVNCIFDGGRSHVHPKPGNFNDISLEGDLAFWLAENGSVLATGLKLDM